MEKFEKYYALMNEELVSKEFKKIIFDIIQKQNNEEYRVDNISSDIYKEIDSISDEIKHRISEIEDNLYDEINVIKDVIGTLHEVDRCVNECNGDCEHCSETVETDAKYKVVNE